MQPSRTRTRSTRATADGRRRLPAIVALAATILFALGACRSSDDGGVDVASLGGSGDATAADEDDALEAPSDPGEAMALFQACMAEHGVRAQMGAAQPSGGAIAVDGPADEVEYDPQSGGEIDPEEFIAASEACQGHLANLDRAVDLGPEEQAALDDARVAFSACMSEHGVEVSAAGGGGVVVSGGDTDTADPQQGAMDLDSFDEAAQACADEQQAIDAILDGEG